MSTPVPVSPQLNANPYSDVEEGDNGTDPLQDMFSQYTGLIHSPNSKDSNPPGGGFLSAFAHVLPSPAESIPSSPQDQTEEDYTHEPADPPGGGIPEHYKRHWEHVPDNLKILSFNLDTCDAVRMTPLPEHRGRMFSESKCFSLAEPIELLKGPYDGVTYCFVAQTSTEIPPHIQEVLFFFNACLNKYQTQDRAPFVFPTKDIGIQIDRANKKTITGLFAKGERECPDQTVTPQSSQQASGGKAGYISVKRILESRAAEQPEETRSPLCEIKMHLGFTGAEFEVEGEMVHQNFAVFMVTTPPNFMLWLYIYESLLAPPKLGCAQYTMLMEFHTTMKTLLEKIMNYELVVNLGVDQQEMGAANDYKFNPGGSLGVLTVLSPFQIPIKLFNIITTQYPNARDISIMGMPKMSFRMEDTVTIEWLALLRKSINEDQRSIARDMETLQGYNMLKDKSTFECPQQQAVAGWPLPPFGKDGTVTAFGLPTLPIVLKFKTNALKNSSNTDLRLWYSQLGAAQSLPELVSALLRSNLVNTEKGFPEISHFLRDRRRADPVLLYNTYYGPAADPFKTLIIMDIQRPWWLGFVKDMSKRRQAGATVSTCVDNLGKYLLSAIQSLEGMVDAGGFRSKTITQMKEIVETMDFVKVCSTGENSIHQRMKAKAAYISSTRGYDTIYRAWYAFTDTFREVNGSLNLNAINLMCGVEVLISMLLFKFGGLNDTWTYFFGTLLIMAGNGHFQMKGQRGPVIDKRKPNTTGVDFMLARMATFFSILYDLLGIPEDERYQIFLNCTRFTPTAWELFTTATAAGTELVNQPPSNLNDRNLTATEVRSENIEGIIKNVMPRGPRTGTAVAINSCDPNKTGIRELAAKVQVNIAPLVIMCSNVPDEDKKQAEMTKSCMVVSPAFCPGSGENYKKRNRHQFQDVQHDANSGRHRELENTESVAHFVAYTHIFTALYCGLINRLHSVPCEINQTTAAFIEWVTFYLQHYAEGIMEQTVRENFSRIVQGYTTRSLTMFVWLKTINALSKVTEESRRINVVKDLLLDLHSDALPIVGVPVMLTCMMSRSIHMGSLLMVMLIAQKMDVPVISWENLNRFFDDDEPPAEDGLYKDEYNKIRNWIGKCIQGRRFCPAEDADFSIQNNISCYITDEGKENLGPLHDNSGFMRFPVHAAQRRPGDGGSGAQPHHQPAGGRGHYQDDEVLFHKMATRIQKMHGEHLFKACHMGPEQCVYMYAMMGLTKFCPDFRGLGSPHAFRSEKHMRKLGFHGFLPGLTDYTDEKPPPFAREVVFKESEQNKSLALGVNIWYLLMIPSMAGDIKVHPTAADDMSGGLVSAILGKAPSACTPGNVCPTRFFDANSKPIRLFIQEHDRPSYFLRPENDVFPTTGQLILARGVAQYLPEDLLPCPAIPMIAKTLHCKIEEVPAAAIKSPYNVEPDKHYSFHVPLDGKEEGDVCGTMNVDSKSKSVHFYAYTHRDVEGGAMETAAYDDWEAHMARKGYVLTPLIERAGACVLVNTGTDKEPVQRVGCLIRNPETNTLFHHATLHYQALISPDSTTSHIFFLDTLRSLQPVGTVMYLKMEVIEDERFASSQLQSGKFLFTRLNVPNVTHPEEGKLYVSALYKKRQTRNQKQLPVSVTFAVNPWDVIPEQWFPEDMTSHVVKHLK